MDSNLIAGNLARVVVRIRKRCNANDLDFSNVKLVGVSKTATAEKANEAVLAGLKELGENRVQEGIAKVKAVSPRPVWHFIGHLQRNKARRAAEFFDVIQSVDNLELAGILSKKSEELENKQEIYIQLNSSGEAQKSGFYSGEILDSADKINKLHGLLLSGIMTIGPLTDDESMIKKSFLQTREIFDKLKAEIGESFKWLSMGMSADFELALDYGANVLRIGTAIFGPREK